MPARRRRRAWRQLRPRADWSCWRRTPPGTLRRAVPRWPRPRRGWARRRATARRRGRSRRPGDQTSLGGGQRVSVGVHLGAHRDRELERTAGATAVADAQQRQPEGEQRVVVDGVDLHRAGELRPRGRELSRAEIRPAEGLANRPLVGLEVARPLEGDDRRVRARVGEQAAPFLECVVGRRFHVSRYLVFPLLRSAVARDRYATI